MPAALAWARANRLDRLISGAADAPIGLITVGKAHEDTLHALQTHGPGPPSATRDLQDRHDLAAGDRGPARSSPAANASSWSSRKSAASSSRRSATRCIICPPTNARRSAARPRRAASRCCRR